MSIVRVAWYTPKSVYAEEATINNQDEVELDANDKEKILWETAQFCRQKAKAVAEERRSLFALNHDGKVQEVP